MLSSVPRQVDGMIDDHQLTPAQADALWDAMARPAVDVGAKRLPPRPKQGDTMKPTFPTFNIVPHVRLSQADVP